MIIYYLDASAWLKRYYPEKGTHWIQDFFQKKPKLASASLGYVEVISTLARKQKVKEITSQEYLQKTAELQEDWRYFTKVQLTLDALNIVTKLVPVYALRGADMSHLACALLLQDYHRERNFQLILVSSDDELKTAAQHAGLTVIDPVNQEVQHVQP